MAVRPIVKYPDPVLLTPTRLVGDITDHIRKLVDDMWETMYDAPGVGLAANQIGIPLRLAVIDTRDPADFATGHLPNALNMPMAGFDPRELPQGKPVVLICQSGERSRNALSKGQAIGREEVNFAGGMNAWRMDARLSRVRTVGTST